VLSVSLTQKVSLFQDSDAIKAAISATSASTAWIGFHDRDQEAGCTSTDRGQGAGQRTGQGEVHSAHADAVAARDSGALAAEFIWTDAT